MSHEAGWLLKLPPFGASSYETVAMPEPPVSPVVEARETVPPTGSPGLSIVALGAVLSIRRLDTTDGEISALPATSVATERRS